MMGHGFFEMKYPFAFQALITPRMCVQVIFKNSLSFESLVANFTFETADGLKIYHKMIFFVLRKIS